jgi:hypothetical protein
MSLHTLRVPKVQDVVNDDGTAVRRKPVGGDLRWDGTSWQRWSGRRWARAAYSLHPEVLTNPAPFYQRPCLLSQTARECSADRRT